MYLSNSRRISKLRIPRPVTYTVALRSAPPCQPGASSLPHFVRLAGSQPTHVRPQSGRQYPLPQNGQRYPRPEGGRDFCGSG